MSHLVGSLPIHPASSLTPRCLPALARYLGWDLGPPFPDVLVLTSPSQSPTLWPCPGPAFTVKQYSILALLNTGQAFSLSQSKMWIPLPQPLPSLSPSLTPFPRGYSRLPDLGERLPLSLPVHHAGCCPQPSLWASSVCEAQMSTSSRNGPNLLKSLVQQMLLC